MQKSESQTAIRHLCHEWRKIEGLLQTPSQSLSFSDFYGWVQSHYPNYLKFRTTISVRDDVELWFEREFGQLAWR